MQVQYGEISAPPESSRFALSVYEWSVEKAIERASVRTYCVHERRLISQFEVKEAKSPLHIALSEGKYAGVVAASYHSPTALYASGGEPIWVRRDIRKTQAVRVIPHTTLECVFGVRTDDSSYLILNPSMGGTRHRIASCTRVVASSGGACVIASRSGRAAGTWLIDPDKFAPLRRLLAEVALRIIPGPDSFLAIWPEGYAVIGFSGAILWRGAARGVLGPGAWSQAGYWIVCNAYAVPNEILAIHPDGRSETVCRLSTFVGSYSTMLARGTLVAGAHGKVQDTSNGSVIWDFLAE